MHARRMAACDVPVHLDHLSALHHTILILAFSMNVVAGAQPQPSLCVHSLGQASLQVGVRTCVRRL